MTEKNFPEDDLKGLEKEIEAAVDRLFVEKGARPSLAKPTSAPPPNESFLKEEKETDWGMISPPSPKPVQLAKSLEGLETQLLSLEWEISQASLERTMEQALTLKDEFKEVPEITSVLNWMLKTLTYMIQNEDKIGPHLLQFLYDSKETLKVLMKKETENDIPIFKKLALAGIEARFACLEVFQPPKPTTPSVRDEEPRREVPPPVSSDLPEAILQKMELFSARLDQLVEKIDQHLSAHAKIVESPIAPSSEAPPLKTKVTLFKIGERLFGVESDKVEKLFKVPKTLYKKMEQQKRLRLNEREIRMVDLETLFSIPSEEGEEEKQVLVLKGNGEYKGVLMDRVLNRLSGPLERSGELNEYIQGMMRWTYQDLPIKVPVLDLKKL